MAPYGRKLTLVLVAVLVVVALGGSGLSYLVGHRDVAGIGIAAADSGSTSALQQPPTGQAAGGSSAAGVQSGDGPIAVQLSPSAENATNAREVADLIARYFGAINRHDYDAWLATVTTAQARRDRDTWTDNYSTTQDSNVYISDITPGDPLTVRMQFVSHQSLEFAPAALPAQCVRWDVTYQILDEGVGLRVGTSAKNPALAPC